MCKKRYIIIGIIVLVFCIVLTAVICLRNNPTDTDGIDRIETRVSSIEERVGIISSQSREIAEQNQGSLEISLQESEKSYQTVLEQYKTSETQQIELQMEYKLVLKDLEELSNELVSLKKDYQNLIKSSEKKDGIITLQKVFLVIESYIGCYRNRCCRYTNTSVVL